MAITDKRRIELAMHRDTLIHKSNSIEQKYRGSLSMYQGICMDGTFKDVQEQRERVLALMGEILDNMYAQHLVTRELVGIRCD